VLASEHIDDEADQGIRIAFDFDGVLADDEAEAAFAEGGLAGFQHHEAQRQAVPHNAGPLKGFLTGLAALQRRERQALGGPGRLRVAVITARSIPAHERAINTLRVWGVEVDDMFFLAGADKGSVVEVLRPHIYFDDQTSHLTSTSRFAPSVHIPFGLRNQQHP
jgi:5'-nucleotidase